MDPPCSSHERRARSNSSANKLDGVLILTAPVVGPGRFFAGENRDTLAIWRESGALMCL